MTPDLVAEFIAEYTAEWNRFQRARRVEACEREPRHIDVKRRISGIMDAIERGIITSTTKERLEALEAEKASLEAKSVEIELPVNGGAIPGHRGGVKVGH